MHCINTEAARRRTMPLKIKDTPDGAPFDLALAKLMGASAPTAFQPVGWLERCPSSQA